MQWLCVTGEGLSSTMGHNSTAGVSKEQCHHLCGQAGSSSRHVRHIQHCHSQLSQPQG